jgi:hypothetical protein
MPSICGVAGSWKPNCHGTAASQKDSSKKKKIKLIINKRIHDIE